MVTKRQHLSDYCFLDTSPEARLSQFERLTLTGGAELERALGWITKQCAAFSFTKQVEGIEVAAIKNAADFYSNHKDWSSNPNSFFVEPTSIPKVDTHFVHGFTNGHILDLKFKSSYQVQNPAYRFEHAKYEENQSVHARMWQHDEGARATIFALHGWTMGDQRLNSLAFLPGLFYRMGLDVVLVELPFHGRRRPQALGNEAGNLFPGNNLSRTNESLGQIISDLRQLALFLKSKGAQNIGCVGMSLGAYVSALWASLDPLSFCIPIVPVVSMPELAWKAVSIDPEFKRFKGEGLTKELLQRGYAVHSPLNHKPKIDRDNALILAGLGDKIIPSAQPRMLWNHWDHPPIHWFRGGHLAQFKSKRAMERIIRFFHERGFTS